MNKYISIIACFASVLFTASCSNSESEEIESNNNSYKKVFYIESPATSTRAYVENLNGDFPSVYWHTTDHVSIWAKGESTSHDYKFTQYSERNSYAGFEAVGTGVAANATKYFILYPYQSDARLVNKDMGEGNKDYIELNIPTYQKATLNSFDPKAAICTGAIQGNTDESITLDHACTFFKITTTKACKYVKVTPYNNSDWYCTGKVNIATGSSGSPIKVNTDGSSKSLVVLNANGDESNSGEFPAGTYLMAIISTTGIPGINVEVSYTDGEIYKGYKSETFQVESATIYNLGTAKNN